MSKTFIGPVHHFDMLRYDHVQFVLYQSIKMAPPTRSSPLLSTVLATGGCGFLGFCLVRDLLPIQSAG